MVRAMAAAPPLPTAAVRDSDPLVVPRYRRRRRVAAHGGLGRAVLALGLMTAVGVGLAYARPAIWPERAGLPRWLIWNLFLAWVPLAFALALDRLTATRSSAPGPAEGRFGRRLLAAGCAAGWFFFFPNAPYLVTDLIHLTPRPPVPLWFDALLLMNFAWTGLLLGYGSLFLTERLVRRRLGRLAGWTFATAALALASFGVHLGRFGRWNSWDVVRQPGNLLRASLRNADPVAQPGTAAFCLFLFVFLLAGYASLRGLRRLDEDRIG